MDMWMYLMAWTLLSVMLAPVVGRFLARDHGDRSSAQPKPLIPAPRSPQAPAPAPWRIPTQAYVVRDEANWRGI